LRADRKEIVQWTILGKEPDCRVGLFKKNSKVQSIDMASPATARFYRVALQQRKQENYFRDKVVFYVMIYV